jgi:2-polyprenyl-3-methyl-5-hydroxy-6-metoxy-1,4-benzoquinol methylase
MRNKDDWDWNEYTIQDYMKQIIEVYRDKLFDYFISPDGLVYSDGEIEFKDNLHPNCKEIYSLAYNLQPKSVLEVGCGGCYLLKNMRRILPDADIHGMDISKKQVDLGIWFSQLPPDIVSNISIMDITSHTQNKTFDFVYTQAVIMHMSTDRAIAALKNIKKIANKHVVLIEGRFHSNWVEMVGGIFDGWELSHPRRFPQDGILLTKI